MQTYCLLKMAQLPELGHFTSQSEESASKFMVLWQLFFQGQLRNAPPPCDPLILDENW